MALRILIVEDDPAGLMALTDALRLRLEGAVVEGATSAEAAIPLITNREYDCVICDLVMPGMDGLDLLKTIRRICPELSVVLMTARDFHLKQKALEDGAYAFLTKPLDVDVVMRTIGPAAEQTVLLRGQAGQKQEP
jgi:DNA-binding NtrC family response regulator